MLQHGSRNGFAEGIKRTNQTQDCTTQMANTKHKIITLARLNSALAQVQTELERDGFWNERLADIDVYLTWFSGNYGTQDYWNTGVIEIPAISLSRLSEMWPGSARKTLRDILRHEYGHAVAFVNPSLIRSRKFCVSFGTPHDSEIAGEYREGEFVSSYAANDSSEDFAETFMLYLKHKGVLPRRFDTPTIRGKWKFIKDLQQQIRRGKRRW